MTKRKGEKHSWTKARQAKESERATKQRNELKGKKSSKRTNRAKEDTRKISRICPRPTTGHFCDSMFFCGVEHIMVSHLHKINIVWLLLFVPFVHFLEARLRICGRGRANHKTNSSKIVFKANCKHTYSTREQQNENFVTETKENRKQRHTTVDQKNCHFFSSFGIRFCEKLFHRLGKGTKEKRKEGKKLRTNKRLRRTKRRNKHEQPKKKRMQTTRMKTHIDSTRGGTHEASKISSSWTYICTMHTKHDHNL